jgi:hypothetical protein
LDGKYSKFQAFISLQLKVQMNYNEKWQNLKNWRGKNGIIVLHPKEGKGYKTKCKVSTKIEVRSNTHMAYNSFASTSTEKCSGSVYTV